jgi:hypothetical protein
MADPVDARNVKFVVFTQAGVRHRPRSPTVRRFATTKAERLRRSLQPESHGGGEAQLHEGAPSEALDCSPASGGDGDTRQPPFLFQPQITDRLDISALAGSKHDATRVQ